MMKSLFLSTLLLVAPVLAGNAQAQDNEQIREQDMRLARISDTLLASNARLCLHTMPITGMILHSADQYDAASQAFFTNGPLAIAAILPGSPADLAGLQADDGIRAIHTASVANLPSEGEWRLRERAFFRLAQIRPGERVNLSIEREGRIRAVSFGAPRGCLSLVEILLSEDSNARSDGRIIQLTYGFAAGLEDEQMAVIVAHELAHNVLEHRRRKEEAGIDSEGLMRHLGRNQQVNRQVEVEADRLSVHLLANAGYDPAIAARFWRSPEGLEAGGGLMPSFIYPSQEARAKLIEEEIALYLPLRRGPSWPGHLLAQRERSFTSD